MMVVVGVVTHQLHMQTRSEGPSRVKRSVLGQVKAEILAFHSLNMIQTHVHMSCLSCLLCSPHTFSDAHRKRFLSESLNLLLKPPLPALIELM